MTESCDRSLLTQHSKADLAFVLYIQSITSDRESKVVKKTDSGPPSMPLCYSDLPEVLVQESFVKASADSTLSHACCVHVH